MSNTTIDPNAINSIYVGMDRACRCGCKGTYLKRGDSGFDRRLKRFMKILECSEVEVDGGYYNISYGNNRAITAYLE